MLGWHAALNVSCVCVSQGGNYSFMVSTSTPGLIVTNNPTMLNMSISVGNPSPVNASLQLSAASLTVGSMATAMMQLYDDAGHPVVNANNVSLLISGA